MYSHNAVARRVYLGLGYGDVHEWSSRRLAPASRRLPLDSPAVSLGARVRPDERTSMPTLTNGSVEIHYEDTRRRTAARSSSSTAGR